MRRVRFFFRWYDLWIGAYWDRDQRILYVCPIPMFGFYVMCGPAETYE